MKQSVLGIYSLLLFILSSCATQRQIPSNDDVYANPKEDRIEERRIAAEKKAAREIRDKRYNDSIAAVRQAQKEKDDANPHYKDREFKYDDYYDYEYATRIKRFDNNISGLGYYDNYYTNSYWYTRNPYHYGVSVYNGYSWWGQGYNSYSYSPSVAFYMNYGWGNMGYGGYTGYNPYDPYASAYWLGYNNGYNNGWGGYPYGGFSYGYNPYGYGYNPYVYGGGYGYPYYGNGWGYYNGYDINSKYTYAPRASHTGNNSSRTSNPGVRSDGSHYEKLVSSVVTQQADQPKFTNIPARSAGAIKANPASYNSARPGKTYPNASENGNTAAPVRNDNGVNGAVRNPVRNNGQATTPSQQPAAPGRSYENQPVQQYEAQPVKPYQSQPTRQYETQPAKQYEQPAKQYEAPVKQQYEAPVRQYEAPARDIQPSSSPSNNGGGGGIRNGGSRPR